MNYLVGGISSAGRALPKFDEAAFSVSRSVGPYLWDQNDKQYIDTAMGFGATMLGHGDADVLKSVIEALCNGPMPSFAHPMEEAAAAALAELTSPLEKVVFVNTGSEAVHLASRTARAFTGRKRIAKMAAGYDGWYDDVAFGNAGSDDAAMAQGKRPEKGDMVLLRFNDLDDAERLFEDYDDIAAILVEPLMANAGCLEPHAGYLKAVSDIAHKNGALVILDEVLMGFRVSAGLTGHTLGVDADLATVGKAIGSGFPVAALLGRPEVMEALEESRVIRAGTYNGNPPACASILATLQKLKQLDYEALLARGDLFRTSVEEIFKSHNQPVSTTGYGTVFTIWPTAKAPSQYADALAARNNDWTLLLHKLLREQGVTTMPFPFGRFYLTFAHDEAVMAQLEQAFEVVAQKMAADTN